MNGQTPPNIDNYTIPGGIKLFFDDGTGEVDFGNIVNVSLVPKTDDLEHYSSRSGKRRRDKVFPLEESLSIKAQLEEPVFESMVKYFKGGAAVLVGSGTATATDQKAILTGQILASLGKYGISAVTVRQFLDKVFMYDGAAFTDHSVEADSLAGTPFQALTDADDELYLGKATPFNEVYFDFAVEGVYGAVVVEYWNGSAWAAVSNLGGAAAALAADGKMNFDPPAGWAKTTVNGYLGYFIKITATTPWTTPATINCIRQNAVQNTDFIIDAGQATPGLIVARVGRLSGGFLADGEEVKVTYTYTTWASRKSAIAGTSYKEGSARLEVHPDTDRGVRFDVVLPLCQLKPDGDISLDDTKVLALPIALEVLDNSSVDPAYPYGYIEYPT